MVGKIALHLILFLFGCFDFGTTIVTIDNFALNKECDANTPMVVPNFKANWFKATEYCHYLNRDLVVMTSAEKQEITGKVLEGTDKFGDNSFWIGGSDLAELGNFHWHSTGRRFMWYNWNELLPIPVATDGRQDYRCVLLSNQSEAGGFKWSLVNCWDEYYFVCETAIYS
ncbi:lithostathine-1-alpha-like [Topomyia yanbarensis]|uniref:lithostathine-1-alpha-like n=1 Tax=Topomyia yanbarensis TaxID=2498891 RepID=UPI00273BCFDD|nr:lithostathine-1-alpha-like [Topomyia yanbarensis]